MKKLGLALGGGGLKGLAHIGVLEILEENRIPISMISGTSSGSIAAALLAAGLSPFKMKEFVYSIQQTGYLDFNTSGLLKYLSTLFIPGLKGRFDGIIAGKKLKKLIHKATKGQKLTDAAVPLAIIACDIDSGREIIFSNRKLVPTDKNSIVITDAFLSDAVRASISIPATFVPYQFQNMQLVDGGLRSIVPVLVQKQLGAEYILAVNLGRETYSQKVKGIPEIISRTLDILIYETSDTAEDLFADMVVYPRVKEMHLDDIDKADIIIRRGRRAMKNRIIDLKNELYN